MKEITEATCEQYGINQMMPEVEDYLTGLFDEYEVAKPKNLSDGIKTVLFNGIVKPEGEYIYSRDVAASLMEILEDLMPEEDVCRIRLDDDYHETIDGFEAIISGILSALNIIHIKDEYSGTC